MSNVSSESSATTTANVEAPPPTATESTTAPSAAVPTTATALTHANGRGRARDAIALMAKHPVKVLAAGAVAAALVEMQFALGLLIGMGATLLVVSRTGAEARRDLMDTSRRVLGRRRGVFAAQPPSAPPAPSDAA